MAGSLRLKVEEIAPTDETAASQAAALATLVTLARSFSAPLAQNAANNSLRELLKTAEVTQKSDRVLVTATLSPAFLASLASGEGSATAPEPSVPAQK
jgi:hypothetical protein